MNNLVIQTNLSEALGQINQKLDHLANHVTDLKIGQVELKVRVERLETEIRPLKEKEDSEMVILISG